MDTKKAFSKKQTSPKKRLPVINDKKINKIKSSSEKSGKILLKPKLNFPKLKTNETSQQRAGAGEPWRFNSKIFGQFSALNTSISGLTLHDTEAEQSNSEDDWNGKNVIGISECQPGFRVPSSELNTDSFESEDENLEESKALKRWKFWNKDKINIQSILSKKLGRSPCELQLQESDKNRLIFEDKLLLTYAQIPEPDKWRGHPFIWKQALRLGSNKAPTDCEVPQYVAVKTKLDKGEIPEMQFIGVPRVVREEKGLICKSENSSLKKWEMIPYREEQICRFREQRKKLKPHNILMDELAVAGIKISQEEEKPKKFIHYQNVPEILVTEEKSDSLDSRQSIFCLKVEGEEIKYELGVENCQDPDKVFTWQVNFGVNRIGCLVEKVLRIENQGTVAVAYDWVLKKSEQRQSLDLLKSKPHEPWFFFNKNSGLFLPGQLYELKFYHQAKFSGIRKEDWFIQTKPPLWKNQDKGMITLSAVVTESCSCKKNALDCFLKKQVKDAAVKYALQIIFYKVFNPFEGLCELEYRSLFLEKDLFEYHNPKHYYHSSIVKELRDLFDEIPMKKQTEWDLSLNSLVAVVRNSNTDQEKNSLFRKIAALSQKLFRRNYLCEKKAKKHKMTYEIICEMVTLIEEDCNYITSLFCQKKKEENISSSSSKTTETYGEENERSSSEIEPFDFIFRQTLLHIKVYGRLCEAVENIVGIIETNKLFEPWKQTYVAEKPSRKNNKKTHPAFK